MDRDAMTPYGLALAAYIEGEPAAQLVIRRDDGVEDRLPVSHFFRTADEFSPIEIAALERCEGHVLDIGAGTGLHSLYLRSRGHSVTAIDVSPQAVAIMAARGLEGAHCVDVFDYDGGKFDTLLMLGHGVGVVEDLPGLSRFLAQARRLAGGGGQWLVHSLDVRRTRDARHLAYHEANRAVGRYAGEIRLQFEYDGRRGPYCGWLHVDPETLRRLAQPAGWRMETIVEEENGDYLARLVSRSEAAGL